MQNLVAVINQAHALVDDIHKHAEGLDVQILLEAVMLTGEEFSEPMDGSTLIATLKNEGLV